MAIDFAAKTVSVNTIFSFDQMARFQTLLEGAALEAVTGGDVTATIEINAMAERMCIDIDIDGMADTETGNASMDGQVSESLTGQTEE